MAAGTDALTTPSLEAMLGPQLTAEQARSIYEQGPEATIFALLTLSKMLGAKPGPSPSTPSAMTPVYEKPATRSRRKKPGMRVAANIVCPMSWVFTSSLKSVRQMSTIIAEACSGV